ncbi:MAG: hypothetical protein M3Z01_01840 [Thermoproteota archaeon]|nr:hypothetical protein [Thermoproteota archaeon]
MLGKIERGPGGYLEEEGDEGEDDEGKGGGGGGVAAIMSVIHLDNIYINKKRININKETMFYLFHIDITKCYSGFI